MPRYALHQSLNGGKGFSLIEVMISLAIIVLLTGVLVSLFSAGIKAFMYSARQTTMLANARKALDGGSATPGMAWQARQALAVTGLSATQLHLSGPNASAPQFTFANQSLSLSLSGIVTPLTQNMSGLQIAYYGLDASGLVMISTDTANARLVTTWVQSQQTGGKTYTFFSAARLRNKS